MRLGLVGLGRIAAIHLAALEALPGVEVVAGCDVDPTREVTFRGVRLPVVADIRALLGTGIDVVVVATPTSTHAAVCAEVFEVSPEVRVLVEKPLATSAQEVDRVLALARSRPGPVDLLYHSAHAPEVEWAARHWQDWRRRWGDVATFHATFADPYRTMPESEKRSVYGTSWLDSGINALSVLARLLAPVDIGPLQTLDAEADRFRAEVFYEAAGERRSGTIATDWGVEHPSKQVTIHLDGGATLVLDHQQARGYLASPEGSIHERFVYEGHEPRLVAHYRSVFASLLLGRGNGLPRALQDHLVRLLVHAIAQAP